jgi:hypothetical protein
VRYNGGFLASATRDLPMEPARRHFVALKCVCALLALLILAALLHVHEHGALRASHPCPTCVVTQSAVVILTTSAAPLLVKQWAPPVLVSPRHIPNRVPSVFRVRPPPCTLTQS